jgi:aryl carrier-like protein
VARETGLPAAHLTEGTDLLALGVDSLRLVRIVHAISAAGGRAPSLTELYERPVLGALAAAAFPPAAPRSVPQDAFALSEDEIDALDESVLDALLARHTAALRPAEES